MHDLQYLLETNFLFFESERGMLSSKEPCATIVKNMAMWAGSLYVPLFLLPCPGGLEMLLLVGVWKMRGCLSS